MTFDYAQTNLQLVRQMRTLNYLEADIARVERTYQTAIPMFSGLYRGSGKPFISHLIGTASIHASHHYPVDMILAGLMHAAYPQGDFGFHSGQKGSRRQRQCLTHHIGGQAEKLVYLYARLDWKAHHIHTYVEDWHRLPVEKKTTIRIRLANEREDFLDNGMIAERNTKADQIAKLGMQANILTLAERADWPELVSDLKNEFEQFNKALLNLESADSSGFSAFYLPPTAKKRLLPRLEKALVRRMRKKRSV